MSIPRDGYYIAVVQDGTGGEAATHVQVKNGTPLTRRGGALKPEACSQFMEVSVPQFCRVWYSDAAVELEALRKANAGLVEKVAETQSELDKSARILLETVNDRNRIGTQLDLIRDELMRIRARIAETGLIREHPELSSIAGYCERAQADIAVLYTPIQECERVSRELTACRNGRAELVEKVAELQSWKDQQMQVESEWSPNDLAALLGGGLGEPQRVVIQREALKLVESIKDRERERDHANAVADALVRENAALMERVMRLFGSGDATKSEIRQKDTRIAALTAAGQDAVDYCNGKHAMAGRVLDGWRKATQ